MTKGIESGSGERREIRFGQAVPLLAPTDGEILDKSRGTDSDVVLPSQNRLKSVGDIFIELFTDPYSAGVHMPFMREDGSIEAELLPPGVYGVSVRVSFDKEPATPLLEAIDRDITASIRFGDEVIYKAEDDNKGYADETPMIFQNWSLEGDSVNVVFTEEMLQAGKLYFEKPLKREAADII